MPPKQPPSGNGNKWQCPPSGENARNANFWPCGLYARTSARLKLALAGQDVANIPQQAFCNPNCVQFALCLPLYGYYVASLQTKVRSLYGINGEASSDCFDGCCRPYATLIRNEQEIVLRENPRKGKQQHQQKSEKPYKCHAPMIYVTHTTPEKSSGREVKNGPVASEDQQGHSPDTIKFATVHFLDDDSVVKEGTTRPVHKLEDDPAAPARGKFQEHILEHDPGHATPTPEVHHQLDVDPTTTHRTGPSKHELG